ncbi:hypothetical protein LIER_15477 [Lithospermum erythrorhizon]|uniref:Uncharacterized protein n=1 Tax=Lithospermum erythrorhizon TaxID=34254 RepID=A0AAV3Q354_LITER
MTMNSRIVFSLINQQNNHGIMDEDCCVISSSSDESNVLSSDYSNVFGGDEDEDEVNSSGSCSSPKSNSSGSKSPTAPLQDMSSILQELPIKRGLSKHYNGKSQSFTSLANVSSVEDLVKPENPFNKRLKSCKSYGLLDMHRSSQPHRSASSSRLISKKAMSLSKGSCSSLSSIRRNGSFHGNRPPIPPPHRTNSTTSFTSQTPLFA